MMKNVYRLIEEPVLNKTKQVYLFFLTGFALVVLFPKAYNSASNWRITHWLFFNYQDQFVKRGLVGELLRWTGVDITPELVSALSIALVMVVLVALLVVFSAPLRQAPKKTGLWLFLLVAATHPAAFQHFSYDMGRYDGFCLLLALLAVLIIAKAGKTAAGFAVTLAMSASILIHEASFFMYVPFVLAYWYYKEPAYRLLPYKALVLVALTAVTFVVSMVDP